MEVLPANAPYMTDESIFAGLAGLPSGLESLEVERNTNEKAACLPLASSLMQGRVGCSSGGAH